MTVQKSCGCSIPHVSLRPKVGAQTSLAAPGWFHSVHQHPLQAVVTAVAEGKSTAGLAERQTFT